jgi:hypothetical protein
MTAATGSRLPAVLEFVSRIVRRRQELQDAAARGYAQAVKALPRTRDAADPAVEIPAGMLDALIAAELARPQSRAALETHYCVAMPAMLATQLRKAGGVEERLFGARLQLRRMPRLREGLDRLFANVSDAGLDCSSVLGAPSPAALADGQSWAEIYTKCHFGRSMPMLYAYPGDLVENDRDPLDWIESRYVGPLVHELAHFRAADPPAPANLHEALAAWIGSEAWPAQLWPDPRAEDALPGGAYFAALGGWIARAVGDKEALRVQAGALDVRDALGAPCAEALRLYAFLPFLETGAPHLLSDAFHPARWWKLIDLHRDPPLRDHFQQTLVEPLLRTGAGRQAEWDEALDALDWRELPSWRDEPREIDRNLAQRAERALQVRARRNGLSFRAEREQPPGPLALDRVRCELTAPWPGPDAVGAPPAYPYPPPLCRE